jgi:hypothetical protein
MQQFNLSSETKKEIKEVLRELDALIIDLTSLSIKLATNNVRHGINFFNDWKKTSALKEQTDGLLLEVIKTHARYSTILANTVTTPTNKK